MSTIFSPYLTLCPVRNITLAFLAGLNKAILSCGGLNPPLKFLTGFTHRLFCDIWKLCFYQGKNQKKPYF
ncbi:MAG: hypothetical protein AMJ42_04350 [Deltaproteobacteria bacterium DG_8]|nr:MAG: hypothetical protein AMJ42_04350 [Deltaproteobacteria bacterium DG_8]